MMQRPGDNKVKKLLPSDDEIERALMASLQEGGGVENAPGQEIRDVRPDSLASGTVLAVTMDQVIVDLSYKSEGIIPLDEFPGDGPAIGEEVEAWVVRMENADGQVDLSIREANRRKVFDEVSDSGGSTRVYSGKVSEAVKGGLVVDIGVRAFLPARELDRRYVEDLEEWVGRRVEVRVIETDQERRRVIVSRKAVLDAERESKKAGLFKDLAVGQTVRGTVTNVLDFGAFVDLGGAEGLIHRNDLAWGRVDHPSEVVKPDQEVDVTILSFDRDTEKIGLSLKQSEGSPWQDVETRFGTGRRATGMVIELLDFGAVVELEPGLEGLVHVSEMRWGKRVNKPQEVVSVGDEVEVEVLGVETDRKRISLSMKKVEENPYAGLEQRYPFATVVEGQVSRIAPFGAFVALQDGVEGMVHVSELSWTERYEHPGECLSEGDPVTAIVVGVDPERQRLSLSIKQCEPDPWWDAAQDFPVGGRFPGTVVDFKSFGALVALREGLHGLIHVSQMGRMHVVRPQEVVKSGQRVTVEVLEVDEEKKRMGLRLVSDEEE